MDTDEHSESVLLDQCLNAVQIAFLELRRCVHRVLRALAPPLYPAAPRARVAKRASGWALGTSGWLRQRTGGMTTGASRSSSGAMCHGSTPEARTKPASVGHDAADFC